MSSVFVSLLGVLAGPLVAAIDAQASSAFTSLSFIQNVGFNPDGSLVNVFFTYNVTNTRYSLKPFCPLAVLCATHALLVSARFQHGHCPREHDEGALVDHRAHPIPAGACLPTAQPRLS